jgi:hypothetical protein
MESEPPAQHPIPIATLSEGVTFPWGLFVDAKRSLYVANEYGGSVVKYKSGCMGANSDHSIRYFPTTATARRCEVLVRGG